MTVVSTLPNDAQAVRVTVAIPTFNRASTLGAALDSALAQTIDGLEVLVCDNASTDGTAELLASRQSPCLRVVRHAENCGLIANWNSCLEHARGEYILVLSDDDQLLPGALAALLQAIESVPDQAVAFAYGRCLVDFVDDKRRELSPAAPARENALDFQVGVLLGHRISYPSATLIRCGEARACGGYDAKFPAAVDTGLLFQLANRHPLVACVQRPTTRYAMHGTNFTSSIDLHKMVATQRALAEVTGIRTERFRGASSVLRALAMAPAKAVADQLCERHRRGHASAKDSLAGLLKHRSAFSSPIGAWVAMRATGKIVLRSLFGRGIGAARAQTATHSSHVPVSPVVAIVLVNWRGASDTLACLQSLLDLDPGGARIEVCVIDNASGDDSFDRIVDAMTAKGFVRDPASRPADPVARVKQHVRLLPPAGSLAAVTIAESLQNLGFAGGNNVGMQLALTFATADCFWLLNNDTEVERDTLTQLLDRIRSDPTIGICGATLVHHGNPERVQALGGARYSPVTGRGWSVGSDVDRSDLPSDDVIEQQIDYVAGASMLVTRRFLEVIGPMSEDYFLYNEEIDWAYRARGRFRLAVASRAFVRHKEGATIGTGSRTREPSALSTFFSARNRLRFASNHTPWYWPTVWGTLAAKALAELMRGNRKTAGILVGVLLGRTEPAPAWFQSRTAAGDKQR